jgi:hypothetical protein
MKTCKCKPECEAVVNQGKDYARGHNPASHAASRHASAKAIRKLIRRNKSAKGRKAVSDYYKNTSKEELEDNYARRVATRRETGVIERVTKAMIKGQKKAWRNKKKRAKRIAAMKTAWADPVRRAARLKIHHEVTVPKLKATMKGQDPVGRPRGPRTVWYNGKCGRIAMRCKSEVNYAKYLDRKGKKWLYEAFTFDVGVRPVKTWTPDFYLPDEFKFIEVKGWLLPHIKRKIERALKHYSSTVFEIISSKHHHCN